MNSHRILAQPRLLAAYVLQPCLLFSLLLLLLAGCNTDDFKDFDDATVVQEGAYAFAVGKLDFTLGDVLADDTTLTIGTDNGIKLIYRQDDFFTLTADQILAEVTADLDETFIHTAQAGHVAIDDVSQSHAVAFSSLLDDFTDQIIKFYLQSVSGTMAVVPAFEENFLQEETIPPFTDYTSMEIESGTMSLTLTNEFFFDIEDFFITVKDVVSNQTVGVFNYDHIAAGQSKTSQIGLAGKQVSNQFKVTMSTLKTPGTGSQQVLVDLTKQLAMKFEVKGLTIKKGVVILQPGTLVEEDVLFDFTTANGERIKQLTLNTAQVGYQIFSGINTTVVVKMTFPGITKNNVPVVKELTVPPTGTGLPLMGSLDFNNTVWRLDQDPGQPYNRLKVEYEVALPNGSNGQLAFAAEHEVALEFSLQSLDVSEAVGYFGSRQEDLEPGSFDLGFDFSRFGSQSSPVLFSDPVMRVFISNSFGMPMQGAFNATATGAFGAQASLNPAKVSINFPTLSEIGQTAETVFVMNKSNSNIVGLISTYPTIIHYEGTAMVNPNNDPSEVNFIKAGSQMEASMEFDLPFKFSAQKIVYRDTSDAADLGLDDGAITIEDIDTAELKIVYANGMPLASEIKLIALDAAGQETVILENVRFDAADADASGRVPSNGTVTGTAFILLDADQLQLLNDADRYIYEITLKTEGNGLTPVAMFTDYRVEMGMGMRLVVRKG